MPENKITMLYIEDEVELRDSIKDAMVAHGFEVHTAGNGFEAFEFLKENTVDIVLSDIRMPEMDGIGLRKLAVKELKVLPKLWIGFSAYSDLPQEDLLALGFDEVLYKPLSVRLIVMYCEKKLKERDSKAA